MLPQARASPRRFPRFPRSPPPRPVPCASPSSLHTPVRSIPDPEFSVPHPRVMENTPPGFGGARSLLLSLSADGDPSLLVHLLSAGSHAVGGCFIPSHCGFPSILPSFCLRLPFVFGFPFVPRPLRNNWPPHNTTETDAHHGYIRPPVSGANLGNSRLAGSVDAAAVRPRDRFLLVVCNSFFSSPSTFSPCSPS